jgi:hypothetical protein
MGQGLLDHGSQALTAPDWMVSSWLFGLPNSSFPQPQLTVRAF